MNQAKGAPSTGVGFEDPPPRVHGKYDWNTIAEKAKAKPLKWYKVFDHDKFSRTVSVMSQDVKSLKKNLGYEYKTSSTTFDADGKRWCTFHIRYNPENDERVRSNDAAQD